VGTTNRQEGSKLDFVAITFSDESSKTTLTMEERMLFKNLVWI